MNSIPKLCASLALAAVAVALAPSPAQAQMTFTPISPCRVWDTRNATPPIHDANSTRLFPVRGRCGVPATAQAVAINVTVVLPAPPIPRDAGNLRLYPAGEAAPNASLLNWTIADSVVANGTIVKLGDDGAGNHLAVRIDMPSGSGGKIHSLADVYGFFQ
jgi:hypothetical protein